MKNCAQHVMSYMESRLRRFGLAWGRVPSCLPASLTSCTKDQLFLTNQQSQWELMALPPPQLLHRLI